MAARLLPCRAREWRFLGSCDIVCLFYLICAHSAILLECYNGLMQIKLLQLNIQAGRELNKIIEYVQKEQFDILQFQEVAGGKFSEPLSDNVKELLDRLGFSGENAPLVLLPQDKSSYFGNATFYKNSLSLDTKKIEWLYLKTSDSEDALSQENVKVLPRNVLAVRFIFNEKPLWFINTHLAWGPTPKDEPYKVEQGEKLYKFLASLNEPFVLSGDFNVTPDSQVVSMVEKLAVNHTTKEGITNTLNPRLHRAKILFPEGFAVDYVFTTKEVTVNEVKLVDSPDLSDHLGISLTIEL